MIAECIQTAFMIKTINLRSFGIFKRAFILRTSSKYLINYFLFISSLFLAILFSFSLVQLINFFPFIFSKIIIFNIFIKFWLQFCSSFDSAWLIDFYFELSLADKIFNTQIIPKKFLESVKLPNKRTVKM